MTKRTDTGYGARRIALQVADTCVENAKVIATLVDDYLDHDPENIDALRSLNQLSRNNMAVFHIQNKLADGEVLDAELLAGGLKNSQEAAKQKGSKRAVNGVRKS